MTTKTAAFFGLFILAINLYGIPVEENTSEVESFIGNKIEYFDVISDKKEKISVSDLNGEKISAIFIFSNCYSCEKNKSIWKRLAHTQKDILDIYGIIMDDISEVLELSEAKYFKFKLYCPENLEKFRRAFKLEPKQAYTILYKNKRIIFYRAGILEMDDYFKINKLIKGDET